MAQHDYIISNGTGGAVRSDLNGALGATVSNNSGATEPATKYAYQWWPDTTSGLLKQRNSANSAWITIGTLASTNLGLATLASPTFTGTVNIPLGSVGTPSLFFTGDANTGIFSPGADQVAVSTAGVARLTTSTTAVSSSLAIAHPLGAVGTPSITFTGDLNTGIFSPSADQLGITTGGVERVEFGTTEVVFNDGGADVDFRVEGDTKPNLFKIDAGTDQVQVANLNGGPLAGFRNLIINGNPTINQRGYVSGAATSGANQYTLDRWRVVTSGQNISFTVSNNVRTVTAPAGGCEQVIEGISILSGTYTLSWAGTATATVGGTAVSKGGNFTLTGGTNATVRFSSGTFTLVQIEPGPVATPFEQRTIGAELTLCQRYFEVLGPMTMMFPWGSATQIVRSHSSFAVTKRAAPTITMGQKIGGSGSATAIDIHTTGTSFAGIGSIQDVLMYIGNTASIEL